VKRTLRSGEEGTDSLRDPGGADAETFQKLLGGSGSRESRDGQFPEPSCFSGQSRKDGVSQTLGDHMMPIVIRLMA